MSWLSNFMHPGRAYDEAAETIGQSVDEAQGYQQPYQQAGAGQIGNLQEMIQRLMNPQQFMGDMMSGYEQSPYASAATDAGTEAGMQTAEQMGLGGSSNELSGITSTAQNISQQDRNNYLNQLMGLYGQAGQMGQNLAGMGQTAAQNMGQVGMSGARDIAGLNVAGNQAGANMLGQGAGFLGSLLTAPMTGGGSLAGNFLGGLGG
jgi:hypothetical protein